MNAILFILQFGFSILLNWIDPSRKFSKALELCQKYLDKKPGDALALFCMASVYELRKSIDDEFNKYRIALESNRKNAKIHDFLGIVLYRYGKYEEAAQEFEQVIKFNPTDKRALVNLGYSYMMQGKYGKAIDHFNKAIELCLGEKKVYAELGYDIYNSLGYCYDKTDQVDEAISAYKKALEFEQ